MKTYTNTTHKTDHSTLYRLMIWANDLGEFRDIELDFGYFFLYRLQTGWCRDIHKNLDIVLNDIQRILDENSKLRFPKKYPDFDFSRIQLYKIHQRIETETVKTITEYETLCIDGDLKKEVE